jgi:hypothetical protein
MEVQRQHNSTILMIRSDNGSEFKNYTLNEFLGEEGIRQQYSTPYTPQQNGVAERKNRTLMDAARMMMAEFKSPYNFWAETISTACHATNRLYLRKGLNKTPYEIITGNKPNIKYFWVFGCKCYILKKGTCLSKFESKSNEGVFVGHSTSSHAYRIYNKTTSFVIETSNMHFDENNGSHVGQGCVCDVDDVISCYAIRRMGVGFFLPIEEHLLVEGEGPCSHRVEPSSSQYQRAPQDQANNEETHDAPSSDHDNDQDLLSINVHSPSHDQDQSQNEDQGQAQVENKGQAHNEDTHSNHND